MGWTIVATPPGRMPTRQRWAHLLGEIGQMSVRAGAPSAVKLGSEDLAVDDLVVVRGQIEEVWVKPLHYAHPSLVLATLLHLSTIGFRLDIEVWPTAAHAPAIHEGLALLRTCGGWTEEEASAILARIVGRAVPLPALSTETTP